MITITCDDLKGDGGYEFRCCDSCHADGINRLTYPPNNGMMTHMRTHVAAQVCCVARRRALQERSDFAWAAKVVRARERAETAAFIEKLENQRCEQCQRPAVLLWDTDDEEPKRQLCGDCWILWLNDHPRGIVKEMREKYHLP